MIGRIHMLLITALVCSSALAERNPTRVTSQLLRHLSNDSWPLERFVDREAGLIVIVVFGGENENPPPPRAVRLCGAELDHELATIKQELRRELRSSADDDNQICENGPSPKCSFSVRSEGAAANELWFKRDRERGLLIDAYVRYPKLEWSPAAKKTRRFVASKLAELRATPCPKGM